jgi:hypothetical protein
MSPVLTGESTIRAQTNGTLAGLALLGALLPLSIAGAGSTYAAVFWPGANAIARLSQAGSGWRVLRVVAAQPVPILLLAQGSGGGQPPRALLLRVPSSPICLFTDSGH